MVRVGGRPTRDPRRRGYLTGRGTQTLSPTAPMGPRMTYRGSLLARIAGTVLIAFAWLAFLFVYLTFLAGPDVPADLTVLLVTGVADAAAIGILWVIWFLRDRKGF